MKRVVVVGGGVIGTACAHYLHEAGCRVTVLDRGGIGKGCSHGNCGYVCPSHVLPLAGPGVIGKTLREFFKRDSAFTIRFRLDPALWSWMWGFARCCNRTSMIEAGHAIQALLNSSRSLYGDLFQRGILNAEWEEKGILFVFQSPREMDHYAHTDHLMSETFNMPAKRYDGEALTTLEPSLISGLAGAWHYEFDAHLRPDRLMSSWRQRLLDNGVEIREQCEFVDFERQGRLVRSVRTTTGTIDADAVIVATGAWTPLLSKQLGCRVQIQPGKGYSITMARPTHCPRIPLIFEEHRVAVTPMQSGYRLGSTMEFAGYDDTMNRSRLDLLRRGARHYLVEPEGSPVQEEWWGWRPMVYDGKPIIGPSPVHDNVLIAAGHSMLGVSMAPATGKLIAELLTGSTPHVAMKPYSVRRFNQ